MSAIPTGMIAAFPEKNDCYCGEPSPHRHAYDAIWDGKNWLPVTSQAGIEFYVRCMSGNFKSSIPG